MYLCLHSMESFICKYCNFVVIQHTHHKRKYLRTGGWFWEWNESEANHCFPGISVSVFASLGFPRTAA